MIPSIAVITTGPTLVFTATDTYTGVSGPLNFGGGSPTDASSGNGDFVSIFGGINELVVPRGDLSDSALSDTATYTGQTFSTLVRPPASMNGRGALGRTRTSRSKSALLPRTLHMGDDGARLRLDGLLGYRKTRSDNALA